MIKDGYNEEVDHLRRAKTDGKQWLADLLEERKRAYRIKNLKTNTIKSLDIILK